MIEKAHLPVSIYTRPQAAGFIDQRTGDPIRFERVQGIVLHWVELPMWKEDDVLADFADRAKRKAFGSPHAIVGFEKLIETVPDNEYAWHIGSRYYTPMARSRYGPDPGAYLLGLEMVHTDWNGTPTPKTEWLAEQWCAKKCKEHGLLPHIDITTHWHITWKRTDKGPCHRFYVEDEKRLDSFRNVVRRMVRDGEFSFA